MKREREPSGINDTIGFYSILLAHASDTCFRLCQFLYAVAILENVHIICR